MTLAKPFTPASYQDVIDAPPNKVAEILAGELHLSPRPASRHARAHSRLGMDIEPFDSDPSGWVILYEPELHLGRDVLVPDLAGWRRERMPEIPDTVGFTLAPDWVCEIASPSTRRIDRLLKLPIYRREDVPWVWLVDPVAESVEVLKGLDTRWVIEATAIGAGAVRLPPFDAIELDPGRWFAR